MTRSKVAVITGATSGIGSAIAYAFAASGIRVLLVGRNARKLAAAVRRTPRRRLAGSALADLADVAAVEQLVRKIRRRLRRIDVLVHAAGEYSWTEIGSVDAQAFGRLFDVNVRAPYLLTQGLLAELERAAGQVIVLNSSVVRSTGEGVAGFKATQHAVQGFVDSLRPGLNRRGIRVSSLYPGQTATPRMRRIYAKQGRSYSPKLLMRPQDVAAVALALTELPGGIEITDLQLRSLTRY